MNLLKDLKSFLKDDAEHQLKIEIDGFRVKVFLDYDPSNEYEENMVIPIEFDCYEQFAYIPHDEFIKTYKASDYGVDAHEISIIHNIMKYLESHTDEICKLCEGFLWGDRECAKKKEDDNNNATNSTI